jgi:hypothetical protein
MRRIASTKLSNLLLRHVGKNTRFDQPSPEQPDRLILLIDNNVKWSNKTGGGWSEYPFCPITLKIILLYFI